MSHTTNYRCLTTNPHRITYTVVFQLEKTDTSGVKNGVQVIPFADMLKKGHEAKFDTHPPTSQDIAIIM